MRNEHKDNIDLPAKAINLLRPDDVKFTGYIRDGLRAYKHNKDGRARPKLMTSDFVILCDKPTSDLSDMMSREAVICLESGQLVFMYVERGSVSGRYDLHDRYVDPVAVMRDVRPRWASIMRCAIVDDCWERMVADGEAQRILSSLH
ncbi:hypothetical protein [Methylobacterium sp. 391_Methyba4]|uniref:hypothetical protein n=1 Tax=Methylobacterium sp. 391_Methyba4 TaxID=3038924 RepID=UPI00241CA95C|nr:hypothetical protein [Methylobacterium sp. 391_Methyba4]WFS07615.1 hypothetical protein P9K36_30420 [Methylobacterium sp. 391_Methyba4]